jgi:IS5 family transposase
MGPKPQTPQTAVLFRQPLSEQLNPKHELMLLGEAVDWSEIERSFSAHFASTTGRPALAPRLVAGLLYLQHAYDCSAEIAFNTWVENPYWQFFTGETYLQIESPIEPSSLTRWRKRIGEEGVETMLMATIKAGRKLGLLGWCAHAMQFRRMKKSLRTLKSRVGRVYRDIGRQMDQIAESRQDAAKDLMHRVNRILTQATKDKNKLYALHAPEVECISKGKARNPY